MRSLVLLGFAVGIGYVYAGHVLTPALDLANALSNVLPAVAEARAGGNCF